MKPTASIQGWAASGFEAVSEAFRANVSSGGEHGAACCILIEGRVVVDLWGGLANQSTGTAWERDTIVPVFSVSKGVAAVCVLHLATQGLLELDAPLSAYWPEFGEGAKTRVTIRQALAHRAGVPFVDGPIGIDELGRAEEMVARVAAQIPAFEPNSGHSYHAVTIGWITTELVRRVTGLTIGEWLRVHVNGPLGVSLFMGLPLGERRRLARLAHRDSVPWDAVTAELVPGTDAWRALTMNGAISFAPEMGAASLNDERLQSIELAGAGLITDARSLATFYAACLEPIQGLRLLSDDVIADALRPVSTGRELGLDIEGPSWGTGVMIPWSVQPMLGAASFGHDGMGGSLAFADVDHRVGFAYVRNGLAVGGAKDPEVYAVVEALLGALESDGEGPEKSPPNRMYCV